MKHKIQKDSPLAILKNQSKSLYHNSNARGRRRAKRFFQQDPNTRSAALNNKKE